MPNTKRRLAFITITYWVMLLYVLAALVWWFISLERQNNEMTRLRLMQKTPDDPAYSELVSSSLDAQRRKHAQYVGEGSIFMLLIVVGAVFVYRATRRQLRLTQQQQNFMMAITHELKTPIAVTRLNIETLRKFKLDEARQDRLLASSLQETDRLNDLCNNILLASRLEGGNYEFHYEHLLLNEEAAACVQQFQSRYPQRIIELKSEGDVPIHGEPLLVRMLLNNLIENALKYSPVDQPIIIATGMHHNEAWLSVTDFGPGIPDPEKKKIFDKFYRMGNENTRSSKGTGLGLFLCKRIMKRHRGQVTVADNKPNGSVFSASFKLERKLV